MHPIVGVEISRPMQSFLLKCPNEDCPGKLEIYDFKWIGAEEDKPPTDTYWELPLETLMEFQAKSKK